MTQANPTSVLLTRCRRAGILSCLALLGGLGHSVASEAATLSCSSLAGTSSSTSTTALAVRGMDLSMLTAVESGGGTFQLDGTTQDVFDIFQACGVNLVRLRLWNNPQTTAGVSYGGGHSNLATVTALAKRAKAHNMKFLLDLHYSDFWTDPGKQYKPKAWSSLSTTTLISTVQTYTASVVTSLITAGAQPDYVQVGNEINSGLLWSDGKNWTTTGMDNMAKILKAGIQGVRDAEKAKSVSTAAKIILHLAGTDQSTFQWWFDAVKSRSVSYDIIGVSYYPYWHGSLSTLQTTLNYVSARYSKPVMIVETAYAYTLDYADSSANNFGSTTDVTNGGYPATQVGQQSFLQALKKVIRAVPNSYGQGFIYWAPDWLPVTGATWATSAGMSYIETSGTEGDSWENQTLFDFNGDALPALSEFLSTR